MSGIPFAKAHGLGNDFLLIEGRALAGRPPEEVAKRICDRHTGVGADGIVLLANAGDRVWTFRIFNADGSEAELSGNAMRCAAAWLVSREDSPEPGLTLHLDTRVGRNRHIFRGRRGREWIFQSEIVRPIFAAKEIGFRPPKPVREPIVEFPLPLGDEVLPVTVLWMGNPQCIALADFAEIDWRSLGPDIERHPYFANRTNAGFVRVHSRNRIEARFWERGAGHTLASGTGSCACAVAAAINGQTEREVTVVTELGEMRVHWREADDIVELEGPAELVAEGVYDAD